MVGSPLGRAIGFTEGVTLGSLDGWADGSADGCSEALLTVHMLVPTALVMDGIPLGVPDGLMFGPPQGTRLLRCGIACGYTCQLNRRLPRWLTGTKITWKDVPMSRFVNVL